jgi:NADPH-dependent 2,4-dienoyl-CoA reductase/sulfur reductase-like enzyme
MEFVEVLVVGSGPAGLSAAVSAAQAGAGVLLVDRHDQPGGQLFKQIHKFFGSARHRAGTRGFEIARELLTKVRLHDVDVRLGTLAWGIFDSLTVALSDGERSYQVQAEAIVVATGSSEKSLAFPGWTLPGVMGAGAAQTMMNVHRVLPGKQVLMVGAGNVGLIVAFQLLQGGAQVAAVVEAAPLVGGYGVHAAKLRRRGVPILTNHSIVEVAGVRCVERAKIAQVDSSFRFVPGTEKWVSVDTVCLAVGLTPLCDLLWAAGADFTYEASLGGFVPIVDRSMQSTVPGVFVAGDASGIEEASVAMETGQLAGLAAARMVGHLADEYDKACSQALQSLAGIRSAPDGARLRAAQTRVQSASAGKTQLKVIRQSLGRSDVVTRVSP